MDYLRSLGTVLVNKSGLNLPFSLGPTVSSLDGICTLYDGTKRDDGSPVSVFEYDFSQKKNLEPLAKNALRKLRTTRHPDVLNPQYSSMTERVRPLQAVLDSWSIKGSKEREDWLLWGLHRVSVALAFLNDPCASTHGNVRTTSVFISPSGEWKLGGLEVLSNPNDDAAVLYTLGGLLPNAMTWAAPEVKKNGWSSLKQAASRGEIPTAVFPLVKNLLNPSNKARWSPKRFLDTGMADSGFFSSNRLVQVCSALDNFTLGSESEKNALLRNLNESADSFPPEFATHRILPSLLKALEFGGASAATMLPLVIKFGNNVSSDEYQNTLVAPLVKLFASPDRGTRMALLDQLPEYVEKLDKKTVDKIFPHLQTGFSDTVAVIREATVKSVILLAPKFSDRVLNNDLLRHLARMQTDSEASIRTNTCILIGRLGPTLGPRTRVYSCYQGHFCTRRVAGLMAFMATIDCFDAEDLATKVIPNLSSAMIDKEKLVRDQAFKAVDLFVKKLESHASTMPETAISDVNDKLAAITGAAPQDGTLATSAAGAAGALAGWAISSIGRRLAATDMQSTIGGATIDRPTSAPPPEDSRIGNLRPSPLLTSVSAANSTVSSPAIPGFSIKPASKGKGLQLGAHKSSSAVSAALIDQLTEEVAAENDNPWGGDDLMDVNADEDDWSAFEVAPPAPVVQPKPTPAFTNGGSTLCEWTSKSSHKTKSPPMARSRSPLVTASVQSQASSSADQWDSDVASPPTPSAPLTKEERAAEMARRKEERKQRIAMLKEQKKTAASKS
ncbi:ARM repeat-containing protein [Hymenopellis radicata]|nr:ARM repeat-containing protein [Hymenopellis radicata]